MVTGQQLDALIGSAEEAVDAGLKYFSGPGESSTVRIDLWEPREVLCHLIFWHQASADGMESVAAGGEPYRVYASTDEMNARAVGRQAGKDMKDLVQQARDAQARLIAAARAMPDASATVLVRADGSSASAADRLETIARHWSAHVAELQA